MLIFIEEIIGTGVFSKIWGSGKELAGSKIVSELNLSELEDGF